MTNQDEKLGRIEQSVKNIDSRTTRIEDKFDTLDEKYATRRELRAYAGGAVAIVGAISFVLKTFGSAIVRAIGG